MVVLKHRLDTLKNLDDILYTYNLVMDETHIRRMGNKGFSVSLGRPKDEIFLKYEYLVQSIASFLNSLNSLFHRMDYSGFAIKQVLLTTLQSVDIMLKKSLDNKILIPPNVFDMIEEMRNYLNSIHDDALNDEDIKRIYTTMRNYMNEILNVNISLGYRRVYLTTLGDFICYLLKRGIEDVTKRVKEYYDGKSNLKFEVKSGKFFKKWLRIYVYDMEKKKQVGKILIKMK